MFIFYNNYFLSNSFNNYINDYQKGITFFIFPIEQS